MKERKEQSRNEALSVKLGESFTPFDENLKLGKDPHVDLEIEGLGKGRIWLHRDFDADSLDSATLPVGPIAITLFQKAKHRVIPTAETVPLQLFLEINEVEGRQLKHVAAELIVADKRFLEGRSNYDKVELEESGKAKLGFYAWGDRKTAYSYFPQDQKRLSEIKMVIQQK